MSAATRTSVDADIDIVRLFGALWREKWKILLVSLLLTFIVGVLLAMMSPTYRADSRVLIETSETVFTRPQDDAGAQTEVVDQESVASQVEIITSTELLTKVAEDLNLAQYSEFDSTRDMGIIKSTLITFGILGDPSRIPVEKRVLEALREKLEVYPVEESRVIIIEMTSKSAELAAEIPNALAQAYVTLESSARLESTSEASRFLASEIEQLQESVRIAEGRVADYRAANELFVGQNDEILATQQLSELSTELSRVRADRSSLDARVRGIEGALSNGAALDTLPDVIASPLVSRLTDQRAQLNADAADLSTTLLANHPRLRAVRSQLADVDVQIREQARKVLAGLRNEASIARAREAELERDLNTLKAASARANTQAVELNALEREAASQRELLETYLVRFREAQSRDEGQYAPAKARQISRAIVPFEVHFPKLPPLIVGVFIGSFVLMSLYVLMAELLSGRAMVAHAKPEAMPDSEPGALDENDPAMIAAMAAAAATPSMMTPEPLSKSSADDEYTVASVAEALMDRGAGRALFLSPESLDASANAVAITRYLANEGVRAVLIDITGANASGRQMTSERRPIGLTDLLTSKASYGEVIHNDHGSQAHVIPTGRANAKLAAQSIARLPMIIDALANAYDAVVLDCGAADSASVEALMTADAEVVISIVGEPGEQARETVDDLLGAGIDDLLLVISDDGNGGPNHRAANAKSNPIRERLSA
ncbi:MAG: exopolysaccharide transport family protein [Pseudomonadota bacterium]